MSILTLQEARADNGSAEFEPQNLGRLEELYRQGALLASERLSLLIKEAFSIQLSSLRLLPFALMIGRVQEDRRFQTGVHSRITGDLRGELYLFLSRDTARQLTQAGLKHKGFGAIFFSRLEASFLNEFANILINSFWQTFNQRIPVRWWLTPPKILNRPCYSLALANRVYARDRSVFVAELALSCPKAGCFLFFLPNEESLDRFLKYLH